MTLTEFLLARIAEDEAEMAEAVRLRHPGLTIRRSPSRFEAECEAKRRILETCETYEYEVTNAYGYDDVLRALAAVYADHPDYDEAWRA
jgi:hypothetical protein